MTVTQLTLNTYLKIQVFWNAGMSVTSSYWHFNHSAIKIMITIYLPMWYKIPRFEISTSLP